MTRISKNASHFIHLNSKIGIVQSYYFWIFSQLVGRMGSRSQGFEGSGVAEGYKQTADPNLRASSLPSIQDVEASESECWVSDDVSFSMLSIPG
jgi:hypothetical protein